MPSACASRISGGISGSMAMQPETWKPPMQTGRPAARNGRARSTARGNWFDCTPTRPISARPPVLADHADDPVGPHAPVGLVIGVRGGSRRPGPSTWRRLCVLGEPVQAGQRVGGNRRSHPLDRIAVVVVMRRLDHHEVEHVGVAGRCLSRCHDGRCPDPPKVPATVASIRRASQRYLGVGPARNQRTRASPQGFEIPIDFARIRGGPDVEQPEPRRLHFLV